MRTLARLKKCRARRRSSICPAVTLVPTLVVQRSNSTPWMARIHKPDYKPVIPPPSPLPLPLLNDTPPTQNRHGEPELEPGMCWGVEIMWSRTFVTELKSTHQTMAAANGAAKRLYEDLPSRDSEHVSCDEPGKPFNAFTCINWGGNSLTVSVSEMPLPKPKEKKPSKPCNGVSCKTRTTLRCWACAAPACRGCRASFKNAPACSACLVERERSGLYTRCHPDDDRHGLCGACSSTIVACRRGCKNPAVCQTHAVICPSCDWGLRESGEDPAGPPRLPGPGDHYETVGGDGVATFGTLVKQQVYGFHLAAKTIK